MNNKRIIFRVTGTYMKKNIGRTLTTFAGIMVMVVLMTAVFVGRDSVMKLMTDLITMKQGSWHAQVIEINADQVEQVKDLPYVTEVGISRHFGYTEFPASVNSWSPYLEIKGYTEEMYDWMNMNLVEGHLPEKEGEIVISERARKEGADVKLGDTIQVDAFERYVHAFSLGEGDEGFVQIGFSYRIKHGETKKAPDHMSYWAPNESFEVLREPTGFTGTYTVVGIVQSPYYEAPDQGGYMAFVKTDKEVKENETVNLVIQTTMKGVSDMYGDLNRIVNSTRTPEEMAELEMSGTGWVSQNGEHVPTEPGRVLVNDMLLTIAGKGTDGGMNVIMIFFQIFFIVLITVASLVLIYNVFNISFRERSRYLGMLSSVGATRSQKKWSVYFEIFSILLAALPLGLLIGFLVVKGGMMLLFPTFSKLMDMLSENVLNHSAGIKCDVVVNPLNILFVIVFSVLATWISAMIPAARISKVGPIESIRGNTGSKKTHKTDLSRMLHGKAEGLIAKASVKRNSHSTLGIVLSITAFLSLTLITFFGTGLLTDVVKQKANNSDVNIGKNYLGFDYMFIRDDENGGYEEYRKEIIESPEVTAYREIDMELFAYYLDNASYTEEFFKGTEFILGKYFPDGIPEETKGYYLDREEKIGTVVNKIVFSDEDYLDVAKKAGLDTSKLGNVTGLDDEGNVLALVYDMVVPSTNSIKFEGSGAVKPSFSRYEVKNPLKCREGESLGLYLQDFQETDEKTEGMTDSDTNYIEVPVLLPVVFAGYVDANALQDYYELMDGQLWIIVSESANNSLKEECKDIPSFSIEEVEMLFSAPEDSDIVKKLAQVEVWTGDKALRSGAMNMMDFAAALIKIANIVAICFTALVAVICLLNLYNSVGGRHLAILKEQAVLRSMGMTKLQEVKILILENARMLFTAILCSSVISAAFTIVLHRLLSAWVGKLIFHLPVGVILLILSVCVVSLVLFSIICYHKSPEASISEELRNENA